MFVRLVCASYCTFNYRPPPGVHLHITQ
uniref:Uncharacterized protein n=1 Tax=Anguilla anguilla TaxID=7936 RepID=A0A0E9R013_ANGAN